ncbi:MAG: hypothetical protein P4L53_28975 [Candidatus Obscuribacterales bacterium]|nr:hypothetical protein [Candidatus Obscuribacterales bacterium]
MQNTNRTNRKYIPIICLLTLQLWVQPQPSKSAESVPNLTQQAEEAAKLLGIDSQVHRYLELKNDGKLETVDREALRLQTTIVRKILTTGLELRTVSAKFDKEITLERQALDKVSRERDFVVAQTNNANFFQLNILAILIDGPLGESASKSRVRTSNYLNIVSGYTVGGLALLAFAEQRGGIRHSKAEPNLLGQPLGLDPPSDERLPPILWSYLNSTAPTSKRGLTRREQLLEYWKTANVLPINVQKSSTKERVSALGPHHSKWCETIKLMNARVTMLFDLRAMTDLLNTGLVDLLHALD